jgi:hypothetical protein
MKNLRLIFWAVMLGALLALWFVAEGRYSGNDVCKSVGGCAGTPTTAVSR